MVAEEVVGKAAWWMMLEDVMIGHYWLGFDYPMSGDHSHKAKAIDKLAAERG